MDKRDLLQRMFGFCPSCGQWFRRVRTARQATNYQNDEKNFFTGCRACEEENDRYWEAMWADFYGIYAPPLNRQSDALHIAFLGWNATQTDQYLDQMAMDNAEQVDRYLRFARRLYLRDGTKIIGVVSTRDVAGLRIDQIILADDRLRDIREIMDHHRATIAELLDRCQRSIIPEEFRLQFYDIDAEE